MAHFIENTKWFCKESRTFIGIKRAAIYGRSAYRYKIKDIFYFPIAYIKFMWSMHKGK